MGYESMRVWGMGYGVWGMRYSMSCYCYIFEGTYEIDELDQAWLQLVNEKRKYKSKACTCNMLQPLLSLSLPSSFLPSLPLLQY